MKTVPSQRLSAAIEQRGMYALDNRYCQLQHALNARPGWLICACWLAVLASAVVSTEEGRTPPADTSEVGIPTVVMKLNSSLDLIQYLAQPSTAKR